MIIVIGYNPGGRRVAYDCNVISWGYEFYLVPVTGTGVPPLGAEAEPMEWRTVEQAYIGLDSGQFSGRMTPTNLGGDVLGISYTGGSGSGSA